MDVVMVAARAANNVIGAKGHMPWHVPADYAHFKRVTVGHPLVLGRVTFESIGKPLPDRQSIVVTRDSSWSYDGVLVASSVEEALQIAESVDGYDGLVNIGGGGHIYDLAMPHATHQILSEIHLSPEGDAFYPTFDEDAWRETRREEHLDEETPWVIRWLERVQAS